MAPITVVVADAQRLFVEAVGFALDQYPDISVVPTCPTTGQGAVRAVAAHKPDVAIVDQCLPGMDASAVVSTMVEKSPRTKVLTWSLFRGRRDIEAVNARGCWLSMLKNGRLERVATAVRWAARYDTPSNDPEMMRTFPEPAQLSRLTPSDRRTSGQRRLLASLQGLSPREIEVLSRMTSGATAKEIAEVLGISVSTVQNHIHTILAATGSGSRSEAVAMARVARFVDDSTAVTESSLAGHTRHATTGSVPRAERTGRPRTIRVGVTDAQPPLAEALGAVLGRHSDIVVDCVDWSVDGAVRLAAHHQPDVMIVDYWLRGRRGGAAIRAVVDAHPSTRVLVTAWLFGPEHVASALSEGACGFLPKSASPDRVAEAIRRAHAGDELVFGDELFAMVEKMQSHQESDEQVRRQVQSLSPREVEVISLLGYGLSRKQVAHHLSVTSATVSTLARRATRKLDARSQLEAAALLRRGESLTHEILSIESH